MDNGLELNGVGELADYDGDGMPAFNYDPMQLKKMEHVLQ